MGIVNITVLHLPCANTVLGVRGEKEAKREGNQYLQASYHALGTVIWGNFSVLKSWGVGLSLHWNP